MYQVYLPTVFFSVCLAILARSELYTLIKSWFTTQGHGEDNYQKNRHLVSGVPQRLFGWSLFEMDQLTWNMYVEDVQVRLLKLYRQEFGDLLSNVADKELVSIRKVEEVKSYEPYGNVVSTWIDNENQIVRTCFNHEWCSGFFFLQYGSVLYKGGSPKPASYPNNPFIPALALIRMAITRPDRPISECFKPNLEQTTIKRVHYVIDLSDKPVHVASRTYILWNIMNTLNSITTKDYNIMIPIPFQKLKHVWNNIGVIFIKWRKAGMTLTQLEDEIDKNKYSAIATNLVLRTTTHSTTGTNTRKNVDLVFTSGYVENADIDPNYHLATFNGVADYGIYCLTATMKNKRTHVSLTFNTKDFEFDKLIGNLGDRHIDFKVF